jgi:hypothetical protein
MFEMRRKAMEADARARRFFFELDRNAHRGASDNTLPETLGRLSSMLGTRIDLRVMAARRKAVPLFQPFPKPMLGVLRAVSKLFSTLATKHLGGKDDVLDFAFEQFATDRLAVLHPDPASALLLDGHGAPNGAEYFKLAELGFLCLQQKLDTKFWTRALPTMVRTAHVFAEHAGRKTGRESLSRTGSYAYVSGRGCNRERVRELRTWYAGKVRGGVSARLKMLEDLFSSTVCQALPGTRGSVPGLRGRRLESQTEVRFAPLG